MQQNYRRCISCRQIQHRDRLIRVVRTYPTGKVQVQEGMGRSAYLCPRSDCLSSAQKKNRLGRSLKASIPVDIYQELQRHIQ
ncbi:MAG: YlxR family protein [Leptolyngbyaceae cyanobacterium]